jgi:hypothetical protein
LTDDFLGEARSILACSQLDTHLLLAQVLQGLNLLGRQYLLLVVTLDNVLKNINDAENAIIKHFSVLVIDVLVIEHILRLLIVVVRVF